MNIEDKWSEIAQSYINGQKTQAVNQFKALKRPAMLQVIQHALTCDCPDDTDLLVRIISITLKGVN